MRIKKIAIFLILTILLIGMFVTSVSLDRPVTFPDEQLELAIRQKLNYFGKPIFKSQLLSIVELNLNSRKISNLEGIEHFRNLEILLLRYNDLTEVGELGNLVNLRVLDLGYNRIIDLEKANFKYLSSIPLIDLNLDHNVIRDEHGRATRLSDIELLSNFNGLRRLSLDDNHIHDLTPLSNLVKLEELILIENRMTDLSGLENLHKLEVLNLRENSLKDISAIGGLNNLKYLNLHSNYSLNNVSPLRNLSNLETLILRNVPVGEQIDVVENMSRLIRLNIRNCGVSDISVLISLMEQGALQDNPDKNQYAYLDILENQIPNDPEKLKGFRAFWDNIETKYPFTINDSILDPPIFSKLGGNYEENIYLELQTNLENVNIYYTLDGSVPNKNSYLYQKPIQLTSRDFCENENLEANIIRARVIQVDGFDASETVTHTYFVGPCSSTVLSLPVVSLAINPEFLFDTEIGIYDNNFRRRGKKWERPAYFTFYEPNGEIALEATSNIRIHGSATRGLPMKSFRIYAENNYANLETFDYEFFPDYTKGGSNEPLTQFNTILFRNSGNDYRHTLFRDAFVQSLITHTTVDIQAYRPINLFINGKYWGIYNIRERLDEFYLKNHYGLDPNDVTIHKISIHFEFYDQPSDANEYLMLRDYINRNDISDDNNFHYLESRVDLDNFIDYNAIYIYANNGDWLRNNVVFWKKNTDEYNPQSLTGHDGRWRWMVIDMDLGFRNANNNLLNIATGEHRAAFLLHGLLENESFKHQFIRRFGDHLNTSFLSSRVTQLIDEFELKLSSDMPYHINRWNVMDNSMEQWHSNVDQLRSFANDRPAILREHITSRFDLSGTSEIRFLTNSSHGHIRVNAIDVIDSTPGVENPDVWSGIYFNDIPIDITAIPYDGYQFSHWEGIGLNDMFSETITILPNNDMQITAVFIELSE